MTYQSAAKLTEIPAAPNPARYLWLTHFRALVECGTWISTVADVGSGMD